VRSRNHRTSGRTARDGRRSRAIARAAIRSLRTPYEQIEVLNERLGGAYGAQRETDRLLGQANGRTPEQQRQDLEAAL
jgi:trimethylamine:corrinoid methyltransferase-like protein